MIKEERKGIGIMSNRNQKKQLFYRIGAGLLAALMLFSAVYTVLQFVL